MTRRKVAAAGVLLAIALGIWWWRNEPEAPGPVLTTPSGPAMPTATAPAAPPQPAISNPDPVPNERQPAALPTRDEPPALPASPQGLRGLCVDAEQRPLADIDVYLVESAGNEPLALPRLQQQRHPFGPLAATRTAGDGTFAVGLAVVQDRVYELYLVSPIHALVRLGGLRLLADEWHDLGAITMVAGTVVRGRVSVAGRADIPVPQALVSLAVGTAFSDAALRALPAAAPGLSTVTDANGHYELRHAPARGVVQMTAVAPGFARRVKSDLQLAPDRPVEVDFALPPGLAVAGTVVDDRGEPIADARIEAWPQKSSDSALLGRSDDHGRFQVLGLTAGPHRLRFVARGYENRDELDVQAGRTDLLATMQPRSRLRVRVTTPDGRILRVYRLALRRVFDTGDQLGAVAEVPEQRVRLDGLTDTAVIADVPGGRFVCQVEAEGYARSWSPPIDTRRPPEARPGPAVEHAIEVVVDPPSTLVGLVTDETGAPLAGAVVLTQPDGTLPDSPLVQAVGRSLPTRTSNLRVTTDTFGRFRLEPLCAGLYQLQVDHPDTCRTFVRELRVGRGEERSLPPIAMPIGTEVSGRVRQAGREAGGQFKVVFSTAGTAAGPDFVRIETIAAADGRFLLPRRVPPGEYELRAAAVGTAEPEAQIFRQLLQLQRSTINVAIAPGQRRVERDLDLPPTADPEIAVSNVAKIALPLLLLAAIGGGAAYYLTQSQPDAPPVPSLPAPTPAQKDPEPPTPVQPEVAVVPPQDPIRTQVSNTTGSTHADAKQGVRGRVLLPTGAPAVGLPVLLLESAQNDPLKIFLQNKMNKVHLPLAAGETDAGGGFQLGVLQPGKGVDLRILSPDHPELQHANIKVRDGDWFDAGDLRLEVGLVVTGRIIEVTTQAPVPNATVFMQSSHQSHAMVATPGRERGIVATTDAGGSFRFTNGPRLGLINLVAEAQGFASTQLLNQTLRAEGANDFTIELELGLPIAGHTVDGDGKPLGNITVTANGLSAKTPQIATAVSDSDGMFSFASLRTGPYLLTATSPQHAETKLQPVMTGDLEVKLVMPARGSVKLRVLAQNGRAPVKSYRLGLKRFFENNPLGIANVPEFPDRNINPGDYPSEFNGQWALIKGLPSGHYRFQITENNHAKTLSPPFQVEEGAPPVEVVCELTLGGIIIGTVIDDRGKPVQGATVNSDMNAGLAADTQIFEIFASMIPEKHTKSSTTTDAQGRFRLPKLAFADYMIRVAHPQYCEGKAINLKLETEGQVYDVGVIQLALGTVIEGVAMVEGVPTGQITVSLSSPPPTGADALPTAAQQAQSPEAQQQAARALFSAKAISDGDGRFRLLKRVPPGTYKVTASRTGGDSPFFALIDMRESERQITVQPGAESLQLEFNLSRR